MYRKFATVATLSLDFAGVREFHGGRIFASINGGCEYLRILFDDIHAVPDALVLRPITKKASDFYTPRNDQVDIKEEAVLQGR